MTFTYTEGATTSLNKVRFWSGDTNSTKPRLSDEEINYILGIQTDVRYAAILAIEAYQMEMAGKVDESSGMTSKSWSQLNEQLEARKAALRRSDLPAGHGTGVPVLTPEFGGISHDQNRSWSEETDRVQPWTSLGQNDNPSLGSPIVLPYNYWKR